MTDILEMAKAIEIEGREQYLRLSDSAVTREVSGVFRFLAGEEDKHYRIFDRLQKNLPVEPSDPSDILVKAKAAFQSMSIEHLALRIADAEVSYQQALEFEKKSVAFYRKALDDKILADQRGVIALVLGEEKRHVRLMDSLIEFVRRPKEWLENAEWNHLDEY